MIADSLGLLQTKRSAEGYKYPSFARIFYMKQKSICSLSPTNFLHSAKRNCVLAIGFCCFLDDLFPLTGNGYPSEQRPDSSSWVGCWCTTGRVFTARRGGHFQRPDERLANFLLGQCVCTTTSPQASFCFLLILYFSCMLRTSNLLNSRNYIYCMFFIQLNILHLWPW